MSATLSTNIHWLMDHAGPVIRYRTAVELMEDVSALTVAQLQEELLASSLVQKWLGYIGQPMNCGTVGWHGGKPEDFETVSAKLWDFGLRAGMAPLDEKMTPFRDWMAEHVDEPEMSAEGAFLRCAQLHCAVGLLRLGYTDDSLHQIVQRWLDLFAAISSQGDYDHCYPAGFFADIPAALRNRPILKLERSQLPGLAHLYALAELPTKLATRENAQKVDRIIRYVLNPAYTTSHSVVLRPEPGRAFADGWGIELPDITAGELPKESARLVVMRAELLAHFPAAQATEWFQHAVAHLQCFATPESRWRFPRTYLQDRPGMSYLGYWMGLEEERRTAQALEIESTFRMLKILTLQTAGNRQHRDRQHRDR